MHIFFPRPHDDEPFAWGLSGPHPTRIWERFSPAYEAQLQKLCVVLHDLDFEPTVGGAGSEDGEYVRAEHTQKSHNVFFYHLECPADARYIASLDEAGLRKWITETWPPCLPDE